MVECVCPKDPHITSVLCPICLQHLHQDTTEITTTVLLTIHIRTYVVKLVLQLKLYTVGQPLVYKYVPTAPLFWGGNYLEKC